MEEGEKKKIIENFRVDRNSPGCRGVVVASSSN